MNHLKKFIVYLLVAQFLTGSIAFAESQNSEDNQVTKELSLQEIALPSEVKDLGKQSGSIYYNSSVKNKVLIPTHFWGEVGKPGLHFIPTDTTLIKGLSMAGGPAGLAKMEEIVLTRNSKDGKLEQHQFNLANGGDTSAYQFKLEPGDSVFIKKDLFREDRAYYTSLIGIAISIISTVVLLQNVKK